MVGQNSAGLSIHPSEFLLGCMIKENVPGPQSKPPPESAALASEGGGSTDDDAKL